MYSQAHDEKEAALTLLEERLTQLTEEVGQKGTELREKESRCAELKQQLTILEAKGQNQQDEVTALNDQLAEVSSYTCIQTSRGVHMYTSLLLPC